MTDSASRIQNIIVFSAGESERNGNLDKVKNFLNQSGYVCFGWRELFDNALRATSIALLPTLLKKIPTFDFSIILGEGVDVVSEFRGSSEQRVRVMRDNVLFEAGLSSMALGADRVIMLIEGDIRIVEDLDGIAGQAGDDRVLGIKFLSFSNESQDLEDRLHEVLDYIEEKSGIVYPVVVGAAISTADGYFNNFVLRFWEGYNGSYVDKEAGQEVKVAADRVSMKIQVPRTVVDDIGRKIGEYYEDSGVRAGFFAGGGFRGVDFRYKVGSDGGIVVLDIPTTITASYNTVVDILNIPADDEHDASAMTRFLTKELDTFRYTLGRVASEDAVRKKMTAFNASAELTSKVLGGISRTEVETFDL